MSDQSGDAMFVALTQPFDNKNMTFGVSTVSFTCVPVEEQFVGKDIRNLGEGSDHSVFGVVHPDGSMDLHLAHKKLILQQNDMIIYANMCD